MAKISYKQMADAVAVVNNIMMNNNPLLQVNERGIVGVNPDCWEQLQKAADSNRYGADDLMSQAKRDNSQARRQSMKMPLNAIPKYIKDQLPNLEKQNEAPDIKIEDIAPALVKGHDLYKQGGREAVETGLTEQEQKMVGYRPEEKTRYDTVTSRPVRIDGKIQKIADPDAGFLNLSLDAYKAAKQTIRTVEKLQENGKSTPEQDKEFLAAKEALEYNDNILEEQREERDAGKEQDQVLDNVIEMEQDEVY